MDSSEVGITEMETSETSASRNDTVQLSPALKLDPALPTNTKLIVDRKSSSENHPSSSPNEKCAICLCRPENRSYTDSCFHEFCFVCLVEWSKVKAECPLCKQKFKNIIHNIKSMSEFDEFEVKQPEDVELVRRRERQGVSMDLNSPRFGYDAQGNRFRYNSTMTTERMELISHIRQLQARLQTLHNSHRDEYRLLKERQRLERLNHLYVRSASRPIAFTASLEFRRMIYERGLRVKPMAPDEHSAPDQDDSVLVETYRDTSPAFYRDNPAQTHRLVRWLHRELNVFFNGKPERINLVCEYICTLISTYDMRSEEFKRRLSTVLFHHVDHFVREFYHFARSPLEMDQYDRVVRYERPNNNSEPSTVTSVELPDLTLASSAANSRRLAEEPELVSVHSTPSPIIESPDSPSMVSTSSESTTWSTVRSLSPELRSLQSNVIGGLESLRQHLDFTRHRLSFLHDVVDGASSPSLQTPGSTLRRQPPHVRHASSNSILIEDVSTTVNDDNDLVANDSDIIFDSTRRRPRSPVVADRHVTLSSDDDDVECIKPRSSLSRCYSDSGISPVSAHDNAQKTSSSEGSLSWSTSTPEHWSPQSMVSPVAVTDKFTAAGTSSISPTFKRNNNGRRQTAGQKNDYHATSSNDDDDEDTIEIVAELLPRHRRTPELLHVESSPDRKTVVEPCGTSKVDTYSSFVDEKPCCSKSLDVVTVRTRKREREDIEDGIRNKIMRQAKLKSVVINPTKSNVISSNDEEESRKDRDARRPKSKRHRHEHHHHRLHRRIHDKKVDYVAASQSESSNESSDINDCSSGNECDSYLKRRRKRKDKKL